MAESAEIPTDATDEDPEVFMVEDLPLTIDTQLAKAIVDRGGFVIHEKEKARSFLPMQRLRELFRKRKPRTDIDS